MMRCIVCYRREPASAPNDYRTTDWIRVPVPSGFAAPFCSQACADAWSSWPRGEQLTAVFHGDLVLGQHLILWAASKALDPKIQADRAHPVQYKPRFEAVPWRDEKCMTPDPGAKSCPNCRFLELREWRQIERETTGARHEVA